MSEDYSGLVALDLFPSFFFSSVRATGYAT
jgi:hypothetical protein